jgi:hypothetical protein
MYGGFGVASVKSGGLHDYVVIATIIKKLQEKVCEGITHMYGD